MDQRIESFLTDVLALAGEELDAVREGVRVALADCEALFRVQETNKRIRDKAARVCRALCRARVAEELLRRRGTRIAEHLTLVLFELIGLVPPASMLPWSRGASTPTTCTSSSAT